MTIARSAKGKRALLVVPLLALALAALMLAWDQGAEGQQADAGTQPQMSLNGPANMLVNQTLAFNVAAGPQLPGAISGIGAEILLPAGLRWIPRATCPAEVLLRTGGNPPTLCLRQTQTGQIPPPPAAGDDARFAASTGVQPPLSAFDTPLGNMVQIDVQCVSAGSHKIVLTAVPDSPFGAVYFALDLTEINVATVQQDLDGDTTMENIADGHVVNCTVPPPTNTPTNTVPPPTPTDTATPCPTGEVPAQGGGCAVPTDTPTPTATPTPLPPGTEVVLSGPSESPPGGAVDVTASVTDSEGNPLEGVDCTFTIVEAPEGSDASLASDAAPTDAEGNATVSLNVGDTTGTINVQADCGGVASQVLAVEVLGGVLPPQTGDEGPSAGMIALWALLGVVGLSIAGSLGFFGWRKAAAAR
jgi:hypothetical protein